MAVWAVSVKPPPGGGGVRGLSAPHDVTNSVVRRGNSNRPVMTKASRLSYWIQAMRKRPFGGAEPLFFLGYYATGKLGCRYRQRDHRASASQSGCALVGGDAKCRACITAKITMWRLPASGVVENRKIIDGLLPPKATRLSAPVRGPRTRMIFAGAENYWTLAAVPQTTCWKGKPLADHPLEPTRTRKIALEPTENVDAHAIAHLTGGGFRERPFAGTPKR